MYIKIKLLLTKKAFFISAFLLLYTLFVFILFFPIFTAKTFIFPYALKPFDICETHSELWLILKFLYIFFHILFSIIISNIIYKFLIKKSKLASYNPPSTIDDYTENLSLFIGLDDKTNKKIYIPEKGLYQNILITGTIGTGKTSSSMYPFAKQLIEYKSSIFNDKLGILVLDVKGNFHKQIYEYAKKNNRIQDLIIIDLNGKIKYNPLDKPHLKPHILANRLKTILTLFSSNNSDSYWLDKAEQVIGECIKLCRLYNNEYVTFVELHNLINTPDYYSQKLLYLRKLFQSGKLSSKQIYDLKSSIEFFENEFVKLDSRVLSILKSEITRITNTFISDYDVLHTFCPKKEEINFFGFEDVIKKGKIVVLNMNISEYLNLSKIIAAYLKLDFQGEVLMQLSNNLPTRPVAFICDEYHEYVTSTDANFFSQSREAKCINIVATQCYTSLLNTLKDQSSVKVITQSLINKLWFRSDDTYTIEDAQKQIGKEDKTKLSKSISENAQETNFNYFTGKLKSKNSSVSETVSSYIHSDYIYDTNYFTQNLETFSCLGFISDGNIIQRPCKIKMIPYFKESPCTNDYIYSKDKII